jgi:hypothetical protein
MQALVLIFPAHLHEVVNQTTIYISLRKMYYSTSWVLKDSDFKLHRDLKRPLLAQVSKVFPK